MKYLLFILLNALAWRCSYAQSDSLISDPFLLNEVVVTDITTNKKIRSLNSITTLQSNHSNTLDGTANLLGTVPGMYTDGSTGEVFTRVFSRGISLSAEDDIGWYYNALQEDGMPVSAVQYYYFSPDLFHRADISSSKVEILKGGKSGILALNAPGGIINFISDRPSDRYRSQDIVTGGIHQNGRMYGRIEGYSGGPIKNSDWSYDFSYLYRYDRGDRNMDYALSNGGQMKLGIFKRFKKGILSGKIKYLGDRTNRYTGVAAQNWETPQPAFGMSFQNTSLLPPGFKGEVPDGRTRGIDSYNYDPSRGIEANEFSTLISTDFQWNGWRLINKSKLSLKNLDWQTAIGGQPLRLNNFLTYFISGDPFPIGLIQFHDVRSGMRLSSINNEGVLNAFQGIDPTFQYIDGELPNDAVMGSGAWKKDDRINEFMNDLRITKNIGSSTLTLGSFYSHSSVDLLSNAGFIYSTYEPQARLLTVELTNPEEEPRQLSDQNGMSNYGALLYEQADINVDQIAFIADWNNKINDKWTTDLGLRYESIYHNGLKYNSAPLDVDPQGGFDNNSLTSYDLGILGSSDSEEIDYNYNYLSYSLALGYLINPSVNTYLRYSSTHKAPELNYYTNNFRNVPVNGPGQVQDIIQLEGGLKALFDTYGLNITAFYSRLNNVPYSSFEFDDQSNTLFYTPVQLNSSSTGGIEIEYFQKLNAHLRLTATATLQESSLNDFTLYDAAETVDVTDDSTIDFSGNKVPHQPGIMAALTADYQQDKWAVQFQGRFMGARYANFENSFTLPTYAVLNGRVQYQWSKRWNTALRVDNLFNGAGLNNFFGPNEFGSGANAATADYISANPEGSFVVFPIQGRSIYLSVGYRFEK